MGGKKVLEVIIIDVGEDMPTFLEGLITSKPLFDPEIIFIDSISTLLLESLTEKNMVDLTNFFNRLKGSGKIIIVTGNPLEWSENINSTFQMICDIHFNITREPMPGVGIVHNIYIEKFNGARHKYEPLTTFSVRPGIGLTVETSGVAF